MLVLWWWSRDGARVKGVARCKVKRGYVQVLVVVCFQNLVVIEPCSGLGLGTVTR